MFEHTHTHTPGNLHASATDLSPWSDWLHPENREEPTVSAHVQREIHMEGRAGENASQVIIGRTHEDCVLEEHLSAPRLRQITRHCSPAVTSALTPQLKQRNKRGGRGKKAERGSGLGASEREWGDLMTQCTAFNIGVTLSIIWGEKRVGERQQNNHNAIMLERMLIFETGEPSLKRQRVFPVGWTGKVGFALAHRVVCVCVWHDPRLLNGGWLSRWVTDGLSALMSHSCNWCRLTNCIWIKSTRCHPSAMRALSSASISCYVSPRKMFNF